MLRGVEIEKVTEMMVHVDHCVQLDKHSWLGHNFITILSLCDLEVQRAVASKLSIPGACEISHCTLDAVRYLTRTVEVTCALHSVSDF